MLGVATQGVAQAPSPEGLVWLVDYEQPSGVNSVCGTGGCLRRVYVSVDDQDYMQVMDAQC